MNNNQYKKYKNNLLKFAEDFFNCKDAQGIATRKVLFPYQRQILSANNNTLIKKNRQAGITQIIAFDIVYNLNFKLDYNMIVVCPTISMSKEILNKVRNILDFIPLNYRYPMKNTKDRIYSDDTKCSVVFSSENSNSFRSNTFDAIYMEEVENMNNFQDLYITATFCVRPKGKMVITSTPHNYKSTFYKLWNIKNKFSKIDIAPNSSNNSNLFLNKKLYDDIIEKCII